MPISINSRADAALDGAGVGVGAPGPVGAAPGVLGPRVQFALVRALVRRAAAAVRTLTAPGHQRAPGARRDRRPQPRRLARPVPLVPGAQRPRARMSLSFNVMSHLISFKNVSLSCTCNYTNYTLTRIVAITSYSTYLWLDVIGCVAFALQSRVLPLLEEEQRQRLADMNLVSEYVPSFGFKLRLHGGLNLPLNYFTMAHVCLCPPAAFYKVLHCYAQENTPYLKSVQLSTTAFSSLTMPTPNPPARIRAGPAVRQLRPPALLPQAELRVVQQVASFPRRL